jgi:phosphotransferase family enzyme
MAELPATYAELEAMKGQTACAGCATPFQGEVWVCPSCGAPPGRPLRSWNTASAWITAVEWQDDVRVVKRLKDLDDERNCARVEREAQVLSVLASQLPPKTVPELLALARGVLVTRFVAGTNMQVALRRPGPHTARELGAAGRTLAALQGVDWSGIQLRAEPGGLIPDLATVEELVPAWAIEAATKAGDEQPAHPVLVHGDFVPSNWLWDGGQIRLVDFGQFRVGSPEFDPALAWARVRLLGGGLRPVVGRRLSALVARSPWPASGVEWRANALVIITWYDLIRFRSAPPGVRQLRHAALRLAVRRASQELFADYHTGSAMRSEGP